MRSGKVISGTVIDLQNVLDIDGGNAFLLHDGIGNRYVIDIGRRRKLTFLSKEMYLIIHVNDDYVIGKITPGELNLRDHIRSKGYECRSLNYSDHINDYKEKLSIYDTGVGIFTENGYAFQKLRWHLLGASFEVLIVPCENALDGYEFGTDYDFIGRYRGLIEKFLTEPENYEQNYDDLWTKAMDNF